jgi:(4-(4-[2-(gamma-L-glutamylamino)ethyl]phenoxymethyl)furan-2-yl)methanamine synthase
MPPSPFAAFRETLGWDLGGAHVKAALARDGRIEAAAQVPCELWRGLEALDEALALLPPWTRGPARHRVTMTGELADAFPDRAAGVAALAGWAASRLSGPVDVYGGRDGLLSPDEAGRHAPAVASANWHATASLVGRFVPDALLADIGSTTSDLVPVAGGKPAAAGYTDMERLGTGELVYTGAVRTPAAALAASAPFRGRSVGLMAEPFATAADIHRLLGALPDALDQQEAADGEGKGLDETRRRLARLLGLDAADAPQDAWRDLAAYLAEAQLRRLHDAAVLALSAVAMPADAPVVGCGAGRFIAERLAERLGRPFLDLAGLVPANGADPTWISSCAPAVAVALLGEK